MSLLVQPFAGSPRLAAGLARAREVLLAQRAPGGYWTGELSSSALSTATAVIALALKDRQRQTGTPAGAEISHGLSWLADNINADGGWGDTTRSLSNISTTALCWAAFGAVPEPDQRYQATVARAEGWLASHIATQSEPVANGCEPDALARAIIARYGKDRTFSVPILTACALAGRLGKGTDAWRRVLPLPFELAALPHRCYAALRLPVVSYALPALIAMGQARHFHLPPANPLTRALRNLARGGTLAKLTAIQPSSGGFLEATPLTSFVVMSLAGSGLAAHPVVARGADFLLRSERADGSWPIDTNLATWVTTLALNAMLGEESSSENPKSPPVGAEDLQRVKNWLLQQQYQQEHPYTHVAPGGWAWTDLPGGVPDADDTAGAVLALSKLQAAGNPPTPEVRAAAAAGVNWLLNLQNSDGGTPTFCRGWGALPFDRSSADLTAHAIRAWLAWSPNLHPSLQKRVSGALRRALAFLQKTQRPDGSWVPLWFGNERTPKEQNPTYGTSRVVRALGEASVRFPQCSDSLAKGAGWLTEAQNADGSWSGSRNSGPGSVEETALAVEALAAFASQARHARLIPSPTLSESLNAGTAWLLSRVESGEWTSPTPIGFYFANLWYHEKLYPQIFTVNALTQVQRIESSSSFSSSASI